MRKSFACTVLLATTLGLALTACDSSKDKAAAPHTTSPASQTTKEKAPEPAQMTPAPTSSASESESK